MEGFMCPMCKQDLQTMPALMEHFDQAHTNEDKQSSSSGLLSRGRAKAKRLLGLASSGASGDSYVFGDGSGEAGGAGGDGYAQEVIEWEPQTLGQTRRLTAQLKKKRRKRVDYEDINSNQLLFRLEKVRGGGWGGEGREGDDR